MARHEDRIRDYLADNLEMIEPGFSFVEKEYTIKNPEGAGGRIDIVARDRYGFVVIIEIKRSDQAARQALNEIQKYAALFFKEKGLDETRVRLMVVSTEWHELLLPLKEFSEASRYSVEGFKIEADSNGIVLNTERVDLTSMRSTVSPIEISRQQSIYFFKALSERDAFVSVVVEGAAHSCIEDFCLFCCDHKKGEQFGGYPFGLYFIFSPPPYRLDSDQFQHIKNTIEWDEELDDLDENFLCAMQCLMAGKTYEYEIGYPEKLSNMLKDWNVTVRQRNGRLESNASVLSDAELLQLAQAIEGGSYSYFFRRLSPRLKAGWDACVDDISSVLMGYPEWGNIFPVLFDDIVASSPGADVVVSAFGPANLFLSLYEFSLTGDLERMPNFVINILDNEGNAVRTIIGLLVWDGSLVKEPFGDLIASVFENKWGWMMATQLHSTWEDEENCIKAFHLKMVVAEVDHTLPQKVRPVELFMRNSKLIRIPAEEWQYGTFEMFVAAHSEYLNQIILWFDSNMRGLREQVLRELDI